MLTKIATTQTPVGNYFSNLGLTILKLSKSLQQVNTNVKWFLKLANLCSFLKVRREIFVLGWDGKKENSVIATYCLLLSVSSSNSYRFCVQSVTASSNFDIFSFGSLAFCCSSIVVSPFLLLIQVSGSFVLSTTFLILFFVFFSLPFLDLLPFQ